jgi:hypothetical protein
MVGACCMAKYVTVPIHRVTSDVDESCVDVLYVLLLPPLAGKASFMCYQRSQSSAAAAAAAAAQQAAAVTPLLQQQACRTAVASCCCATASWVSSATAS